MKKILAALVLLIALPALGQAVDSSQMKLKTNGGLAGDAANALAAGVYRATSAPSSPVTGQQWCDTTTTPCVIKQYDGAAWITPVTSPAITVIADMSVLPGSPTDGQIVFCKSPATILVYNGTTSAWQRIATPLTPTGASISDVYTATVISAPGAACTAATSATAGSTSAGNYSYKVAFSNSTGGDTTMSAASNSVAPGASKSNDLSSIPTGGTGTTARRIYRSKANQDVTGPWYYLTTIADNATTTYHDGAADSSIGAVGPTINFSGAMPGAWTFILTSSAASGCGTTTRNTMACQCTGQVDVHGVGSDTAEGRANLDITSYASGDYTIQYRVTQASQMGDAFLSVASPTTGGLRNGTADNAPRLHWKAGGATGAGAVVTFPLSGSVHPLVYAEWRLTVGGTPTVNGTTLNNPFPEADALPLWYRVVKRGASITTFWSADGANWVNMTQCGGTNVTNAACSWNSAFGASTSSFELPVCAGANGVTGQVWVEIDSFTLTVN